MSSKNELIGAITCALPGMDPKNLRLVRDASNRLNGEDASLWHPPLAKVLRVGLPKEKGQNRQYHFLKPVAEAVATIFDPQLLTAREDIWMSPEFIEQILSVAETFQPTDDLPLPIGFDVVEPGNDTEIRSEFPKDHVYGASEFCWRLSKMAGAQPNGASGTLLNNGYANIFYVIGKGGEVFAVRVYWNSDRRQWDAHCYRLVEGDRWLEGRRAFSRN